MENNNGMFCLAPWVSLFVGQTGRAAPCCFWDHSLDTLSFGSMKNSSIEEIINSPGMVELRRRMLSGEHSPGCSRCEILNDVNSPTRNQMLTQWFEDSCQADSTNINLDSIRHLDIRYSNLCNLECISCNDKNSSKKSGNVIKWLSNDSISLERDILSKLPNVSLINFAGGEPLIMEEQYQTLDYFIQTGRSKNIKLIYFSNLTRLGWGSKDIFEYWKNFKRVSVNASIDHYGEKLAYVRFPASPNVIENNLALLKTSPVSLAINLTVSVLNIYDLAEICDHYTKFDVVIKINVLTTPAYLSATLIPFWDKQRLIDKYKDYHQLAPVVNLLRKPERRIENLNMLRQTIVNLDSERDVKFNDLFTEFDWLWK